MPKKPPACAVEDLRYRLLFLLLEFFFLTGERLLAVKEFRFTITFRTTSPNALGTTRGRSRYNTSPIILLIIGAIHRRFETFFFY